MSAPIAPELAKAIAVAIASSAHAVLAQRKIRDDAGDLSREIGNNSAQAVILLLDEVLP